MADRFVPEPNWWWDTQRARAVERGEADPGPLYRDTQHGKATACPLPGFNGPDLIATGAPSRVLPGRGGSFDSTQTGGPSEAGQHG